MSSKMLLPELAGSFSAEVPVCWKSLGAVISLIFAAMPGESSWIGLDRVLVMTAFRRLASREILPWVQELDVMKE